jgi:hypothetical protein
MIFSKATRKQAKLRLALTSPSGGGKTYGALLIAKGLGGRIAVIDTERGSASLYEHLCNFDVLDLEPPYSPERYIQAVKAAEQAGYDICIIDSTTQEWSGTGGCLEINEQIANTKFRGNTWSAWNETTPRHRAFIDSMVQSKMHIIATGRSKTETVQQQNDNGKKSIVKLGLKTEQRDGFEYEFTVVLDLIHDGHWATASKDRTGIFKEPHVISEKTGHRLKDWLDTGAEALAKFEEFESKRLIEEEKKELERLTNLNLSLSFVKNSSTIEELKINAGKAKLLTKQGYEMDELLDIFNEIKYKIEEEQSTF